MNISNTIIKNKSRYLILAIALLALPVSIYLARVPTRTNTQAATGKSVLAIQPAQSTPRLSETASFSVNINPNGDQVNSVELHLTYNASVIQVNDIQPGNFFTDFQNQAGGPPVVIQKVFGNGDIRYAIGYPLGSNYGGVIAGSVANVTYQVIGAGTSDLTIDTTSNRPSLVANLQAENTLASATNGQIIVNTDTPTLAFTNLSKPNPQTVNQNFTIETTINSAGEQLSAVDADITFNPQYLKVISVEQSSPSAFNSYAVKSFDNTAGTINIAANIGTSTSPTPAVGNNLIFAKITFQPLKIIASTPIQYQFTPNNPNDSNLVKFNAGNNPVDILAQVNNQTITIIAAPTATLAPTNTPTPVPSNVPTPTPTNKPAPTAVPSPTPTIAPTPVPTLSATIQVNFQGKGIASGIAKNLPITIEMKKLSNNQTTIIQSQTNTDGQSSINATSGNYIFTIKAPGYLAKKFGTTTTPINITTQGQLINLTQSPLLGGDFNGDGEINEIDYILHVLPNFFKNYSLADLDRSGELNALDFAIMRDNVNKQDDILQ